MTEFEANHTLCLHLGGTFYLQGNVCSDFNGPIKSGLRLVMWGNSEKKATSCVFVSNTDINLEERKECEVVILSPQSIDKKIILGDSYPIGIPGIKLGEFKLNHIIGEWTAKLP